MRFLRALLPLVVAALGWSDPVAAQSEDVFAQHVAAAKAAMQSQPERGIALARDARVLADHSPPKLRAIHQAEADWLEGEGFSRLGRSELAWPLLNRALRSASANRAPASLIADILLAHGAVSVDSGRVAIALNDFQRAYRLYLQIRNYRGQTKALIELALLHHGARDSATALKYFARAAELEQPDIGVAVAIHNGLGNELRDLSRYRESRLELKRATVLAQEMGSELLTATVLTNAARTAISLRDYADAERLVRESQRASNPSRPRALQDQQLAILAEIAADRGRNANAAALLDQVFAGVDLTKTTLSDRDAHRVAVDVYRRLGRNDLALVHLTALKRLDDDATAIARSYSAALVGARFDFASQEVRIARLKALDLQKSVSFERARAETQRLIFYGVAAGTLVIVALLAFSLFVVRRSRDRLARSNLALGKALAAKTEFLATTSHEIRTPLNGILGMTQVMLADRSLPAPTHDRVSVVHTAGLTMRALVDDILDTAKIESGNLAIERVPFDLCATVGEASRIWEEQARAKDLSFHVELQDCPARIVGDAARVRQIVFNLLANAVKFTPAGSITVTAARCGARYQISVADTGIGIARNKLETVFESFAQEDATTTRRFGGTGLGLSICRSLARAMDGEVTVESTPGVGSRFVVDLPLTDANAVEQAAEVEPCSLLIIESNPIGRAMLRTLFTDAGETVAVAETLEAGLVRLAAGAVDSVLVDRAVLGDEWAHALADVAARKGSARLCVTWPADDANFAALSDHGVSQAIGKPLSRNALVEAVRRTERTALESRAA